MTVLRKKQAILAVAAVCVMALYVGLPALLGQTGFPLDDAWIHQTYARNLAQNGRWEYVPGVSSAGSTAPLWTMLLAVGYMLGLPYLLWAYALGTLVLIWLVWSAAELWEQLWPDWQGVWVGLAILAAWPLVWAAGSGMETLLFGALGLQIACLYVQMQGRRRGNGRFSLLGILCGLLILTRPDGLVLVLLIVLGWLFTRPFPPRSSLLIFFIAILLPLLPYFAFNWWTSGAIWPNTLYAKQAEYAILLERPFLSRLSQLLFFSLGGAESGWQGMSAAHLVLLPGVITAVYLALQQDAQKRRLFYLVPLLWAAGHVFLYAWRLPVTYQHGRYLLPIMPVWIVYGLAGWRSLLGWLPMTPHIGNLVRLATTAIFVILQIIFLVLGWPAYVNDVAVIEGEMVDVAHWLAENTAPDALIAAHDIGAIGYFAERPLLDLAGLISPEVVPMLADEQALAQYILQSKATYLVTAPGWTYTEVVKSTQVQLLYSTGFVLTQEQGLNNMAVYQLRP